MIRYLRKALNLPDIYKTFARTIGGDNEFSILARDYLRAIPGYKILDIGCGPADILRILPEVDYTGFDLSPDYIAAAQAHYGNRGKFYCQAVNLDAFKETAVYDCVLASGVVHHLSDEEATQLFEIARRGLKPGGRLVTCDGCFEDGQSPIARYLLSQDRGRFVRTKDAYEKIVAKVFAKRQLSVRHDLLRIPYTHLIMECTA